MTTGGEPKPQNPCRYCHGGLGVKDGVPFIEHGPICPAVGWNAYLEHHALQAMMESLAHPDRLWYEQPSYQEAVARVKQAREAYEREEGKE